MSRFVASFRWHLGRERARMLGLAICAGLFLGVVLGISNSVQPAEIQVVFDKLPPALHAMLGLEDGVPFDLSRWVGLVHGHPVWLVAVLAFPLAAALRGIAGGVEDGSLEVVLSQPIGRTSYYASLASVVALGSTVVLAGSLTGGLLARSLIELPGELPTSTLLQLSISGWALAIAAGGIGLLASAAGAGGGRPTTWAVGIVVAMFFVRFVSDMVPTLSWLQWLSIFGYHDAREIVGKGLQPGSLAALLFIGVSCAGVGAWVFRRKQLTF
jgi:hypothetical protein